MTVKILTILALIAAAVFIGIVSLYIYRRLTFVPTADRQAQAEKINRDLSSTGFAYSLRDDCFYATVDCWQRKSGYCKLYDDSAAAFQMIIDCEPVPFSYAGKDWLIELWKGQYGITTGAEVGFYQKIENESSSGAFYRSVSDKEMLPMMFNLRKNGKPFLKRSGIHWWLTGFRLGAFSDPEELSLAVKIRFREVGMAQAFIRSLRNLGYTRREATISGLMVSVCFTKPHTKQPITQSGVAAEAVQVINQNNCRLYEKVTNDYTETLDKLEYIKAMVPGLYRFFLDSLYSKAFYGAFSHILDRFFQGENP